jgi:hypothetical protein
MSGAAQILETMGPEQCLLAFVFIGSYAVAVGELANPRWRRIAAFAALASAAACAALSEPWEQGVILVAIACVGMAVFAGVVWGVWAVARWHELRQFTGHEVPVKCTTWTSTAASPAGFASFATRRASRSTRLPSAAASADPTSR